MSTSHTKHLRLAIRVSRSNENHHLGNNNGTWWINFTMRSEDGARQRIRHSLKTSDIEKARASRDKILRALIKDSGHIAA